MQCFRYQIFQVVTMLRDKILSNNNKSHAFTHFFSLARQKCVNFLFFSQQTLANSSQQKASLLLSNRPNLPPFCSSTDLPPIVGERVKVLCHLLMSYCFLNTLKLSPCHGRAGGLNREGETNVSFIPAMTQLVFSPVMGHGKRLGLTTADTLSKQRNQPSPNPNWSALGRHVKRTHRRFWAFIRAGIRRMLALGN